MVCDNTEVWRKRVSNLEEDIAHLNFMADVARATHEQEIATLRGRINGKLVVHTFFPVINCVVMHFQIWNVLFARLSPVV